MKIRLIRLVWMASLAVLLVCEKNLHGPDTDRGSDSPIQQGDLKLLATATIGPDGGAIFLDSLSITIPAHVFLDKTFLTIYSSQDESPFAENTMAPVYQINGLPENFAAIHIRMAFSGPISGDTLIAIGEKGYAKSRQDSTFAYVTQKATLENDQLLFFYGGSTALGKTAINANRRVGPPIRFTALTGYSTTISHNNHFEIHHPADKSAQAVQLGTFFEAAYDTFQTMGFSFSGRSRTVPVMVMDMADDGEYIFYMPNTPTDASIRANIDKGRFSINTNILENPHRMAVTTGHEFMHLVQNVYEFSDPFVRPEQMWLAEALAVWAESKFASQPDYVSPQLFGNEIRFFLGWQHAAAVHGYAMSTLIKNIADTFGDAAILKILQSIRDGNVPTTTVDPVDAVLSVITAPVEAFWHQSLVDYMLGKDYGGAVSRTLLNDPANFAYTFTVDGPEDSLHTMVCGFNDLSGALFKIELDDAAIDTAASFSVAVDDTINCGMALCAYKNGAINLLQDILPGQTGRLILNNLHQLAAAGQDLVLLLSNGRHVPPYDGTNDVSITLHIHSPKREDPAAPAPQLIAPNTISMGFWNYLRYCQTPYGQNDALFSYTLSDPNAAATVSIFKPDSGWIFSQPINGLSSVNFTGEQLGIIAPDMCPGAVDSLFIRVENEFGADTSVTVISVGGFFDGVALEDSLANWKNDVHPEWFCVDPSLSGSFSGSSLLSAVNRQNYECGVVKSLSHSTTSRFNFSLSDCVINGNGSSDYKINSSQAQPAEEQWNCSYTFNNPFNAGIASFDDVDYFLFMNVSDVNTRLTRKEVWTDAFKPDSVWTKTENIKASFLFGFKGKILY